MMNDVIWLNFGYLWFIKEVISVFLANTDMYRHANTDSSRLIGTKKFSQVTIFL